MDDKYCFTEGPILPKLLRFSIPILAALLIQALYGAVDIWAVGMFSDTVDLSAVSTGSQVLYAVTGFVTGLSMGITVLLGKKIGERNYETASHIVGASFWLLIIVSSLLSILILGFTPSIAEFVNAPKEAFSETVLYLRICGSGIILITAYNGFSSIFRGMGNSNAPLFFVFVSSIINIFGDIVLIKCFGLGAAGAALATVFSQGISVIFSLIYLKKKGFTFPLSDHIFRFRGRIITEIVKLGLPVGLCDLCNEICSLIIVGFANVLGLTASAGVGIAEKAVTFLYLIPIAYMSALSAFTAQNVGAGKEDRAKKAMWLSMSTAVALSAVIAYILGFHGEIVSSIFSKNIDVVSASATFLKATSLECLILSVAYCFTGYFNGKGKTRFVMMQGLIAIFFVKIPYSYIALHYLDNKLYQIGFSTVLGAITTLTLCIIYYIYNNSKSKK